MIICGCDPGLSGGIAFFYGDNIVQTWPMPTFSLMRNKKNKRELDAHQLADILRHERIDHAFVERVGAMPGQGNVSSFAFGKSYGIILGVISAIGIPYNDVLPQTWKKSFGLTASKDAARFRASQIFPSAADQWSKVKDDGRAEAALLAKYGERFLAAERVGRAA